MNESAWNLFQKGGLFMWPILLLSLVAIVIIIERLIYFCGRKYRVGRELKKIQANLKNPTALNNKNPIEQIAAQYLEAANEGDVKHIHNVVERAAHRSINRHERGLKILSLIGSISPLVGLLGTVWGMVQAFSSIAELGDAVRPSDLAGGIWTGLLTTVAGLVVAIPAVSMARIFEAKIDHLVTDLNETISHLDEWTGNNK